MISVEDKKRIYRSFLDGTLKVLSSSVDKRPEWKRVVDVTKHDVSRKDQYEVTTIGGQQCRATGDHSLFLFERDKITERKTGLFSVGDNLTVLDGGSIIGRPIRILNRIPPLDYMYDLSVEDNHNFFLKSGILAHNTFRPPATEKFIQAQAQVFGYLWEDEELYEYLLFAVDLFNTAPPVTGITLMDMPDRWRSVVLLSAAARACAALSLTWIVNEFSYSVSGVSLDIEKSSKYESMKNNFEQEYDKAEEKAKTSVKIVKGLRQPRYGVGISSALGPFSKPGVQSRRNFASGGRGGWA
jgi:hypothetical protein